MQSEDDQVMERRLLTKESVFLASNVSTIRAHWTDFEKSMFAATGTGKEAAAQAAKWLSHGDMAQTSLRMYNVDMRRGSFTEAASRLEIADCERKKGETEAAIKAVANEIAALKAQLAREKITRLHKEQYEDLGKLVNRLPPQKLALQQVQQLDTQIEQKQQERAHLDATTELKKKQMHLLQQSIYELQAVLHEGDDYIGATPAAATASSALVSSKTSPEQASGSQKRTVDAMET
jgi:chromosome segregation ATPase